ncbi:MAG: IS1634 family transposase, partial [Thermoplasmatota archaeon]
KLNYVTARQINKNDEQTWIKDFDKEKAELVDADRGVYGLKRTYPSRTTYLYFSEQLYMQQMSSKRRKVERLLDEALQVQRSIDTNRGLPKRYQINNPLIDCQYSYQTKLAQLSEPEARAILKQGFITGREGFFCLVSSEDLTAKEALIVYRQKDSLEKIFHSFKNEIDISPLRVWAQESIYGALIIGFIAQLFISLIRFEHRELKHTSPKFIKLSLMNLTVTVEYMSADSKRHIYSNFSPAAEVILAQNHPFG